ncbi:MULTISPECIES: hypothetical protein [unclassified Lacticaseibacillus]|uniref:hypothetical protein n=1 Tax=unclassified Lacticaseibacillus TaxID=2759744 RepID=UPI0019452F4D|nr:MULTISPECIES: hypothetical protein [unclassified Lacticaseibacillus]
MDKNSGFHSAMTLAEVLVALALMSGLLLIWRPVLGAVRQLPNLNQEVAMLQMANTLTPYMAKRAEFKTVMPTSLYYNVPDRDPTPVTGGVQYQHLKLEVRRTASGSYLQGSGTESGPGTTPLIYGVAKIRLTDIGPGSVRYELFMLSGARLTGVLNDKTTR